MELMDAEAGGVDPKHNERQELLERFKSHHAEALALGHRSIMERGEAARVLWEAKAGIDGPAWSEALKQAGITCTERTIRDYLTVGAYLAGVENGDSEMDFRIAGFNTIDPGDKDPRTFGELVDEARNWHDEHRAADEQRQADEWRKREEKAAGHEEKGQELRGRVERRTTGGTQAGLPFGPDGKAQPEKGATGGTPAPKKMTAPALYKAQGDRAQQVLGRVDCFLGGSKRSNGQVIAARWYGPGDEPEWGERMLVVLGKGNPWEDAHLACALDAVERGAALRLVVELSGSVKGRVQVERLLATARAVVWTTSDDDVDLIAYCGNEPGLERFLEAHKSLTTGPTMVRHKDEGTNEVTGA